VHIDSGKCTGESVTPNKKRNMLNSMEHAIKLTIQKPIKNDTSGLKKKLLYFFMKTLLCNTNIYGKKENLAKTSIK
jgi:hypothetical protein